MKQIERLTGRKQRKSGLLPHGSLSEDRVNVLLGRIVASFCFRMVITANDPHRPPVGHSSISILVPRLSHGCAFQNKQIVQNNVLLYGFAIDKPTDASDHLIHQLRNGLADCCHCWVGHGGNV